MRDSIYVPGHDPMRATDRSRRMRFSYKRTMDGENVWKQIRSYYRQRRVLFTIIRNFFLLLIHQTEKKRK